MRSCCWILIAAFLFSGCGSCASENKAAADAATIAAQPQKLAAPVISSPEAAWANKYWVIVSSNEEAGLNPPALETLRAP